MNLQEELKALRKRIAELEEQVEEEQDFPQKHDEYWYVDDDTEVLSQKWHKSEYDECRLSIDNIFKTKDQAEFTAEKLKVEAELRKLSRPFKDNDNNYYIELYLPDKKLSKDRSEHFKTQGTIYFESKKVANEAIDTVGADRIKKYIFEVED